LTAGSKFEHNDYTGFAIQPGGRILWTPTERQSFWGSVSRAVRTPSRSESDVVLMQPTGIPGVIAYVQGAEDFDAEKLIAYELGHRMQLGKKFSLDSAFFYNVYNDLRSVETQAPIPGVPLLVPTRAANNLYGETYGFEISPTWQVTEWWRLQAGYSLLKMQLHKRPASNDSTSESDERRNPQNQFSLRSGMDLGNDVQFDAALRYVDNLPAMSVSSYLELDLRLGWMPIKNLEFSISGQNLLHAHHSEFNPSFLQTQRAEVERSVYGKITWRF
ncbi:MAG TPA: TonB-dependent receptor, partial [Candidatus Saccharimonadales bacterium]|nr:TonB-dependent receptor [Candidatus Saccharimonadales bacterium]